jgi:hypothetical protein
MYKLEIKLEQHTPIIHFQHDQAGATLRATEVKPKLDRWLIKLLDMTEVKDGKVVPKNDYKDWFVAGGKLALNYKMVIIANGTQRIPIENRHVNSPMYFANMGNTEHQKLEYKHLQFSESNIDCTLSALCKELVDIVKIRLEEFFFLHNFGTRQSKGYGSFTVASINSAPATFVPNYRFQYNAGVNNWLDAMKGVSLFYRSIRSGINEVRRPQFINVTDTLANKGIRTTSLYYFKSIMFLYAKSRSHQWDKKSIKQHFAKTNGEFAYRRATRNEQRDEGITTDLVQELGLVQQLIKYPNAEILSYEQPNGTKYDYKDTLGLSSTESWKSYGLTISKVLEGAERYQSPIMFKPVKRNNQYQIYLITSGNNLSGKGVTISHDKMGRNEENLELKLADFDINNFLNFVCIQRINDIVPDREMQQVPTHKTLSMIYHQLNQITQNA